MLDTILCSTTATVASPLPKWMCVCRNCLFRYYNSKFANSKFKPVGEQLNLHVRETLLHAHRPLDKIFREIWIRFPLTYGVLAGGVGICHDASINPVWGSTSLHACCIQFCLT